MRFGLVLLLTSAVFAQTPSIRLHRVASGFEMPTDIKSPHDSSGRLFVVEQRGRIRIIDEGRVLETPFLDIRQRVSCCSEQGLLGLAFPPKFASRQYFYINYTNTAGDTVISRLRVSSNPDIADAASEQILLTIAQPFPNHNGGNLVFGPDGYLYIGTGDGGGGGDPQDNGQNPGALLGKMLRLDVESGTQPYTSPQSNPFVNRSGARPEVWAIGLRNPWKYSFDRETGDLWIADVGQNRAEEVNFVPASSGGGENYGWDRMEGLQCYPASAGCSRDGLTLPVLEYTRDQGVSVTGGYVYRGSRYPGLHGIYFYGDYGSGNLWGVTREGSTFRNRLLNGTGLQISTFGEDEQGEIYLADHRNGGIYLVAEGAPVFNSEGVVNAASFEAGITPGSLATIFGTGITAFGGIIGAQQTPLPAELAGTSVTMNGVPAPLIAVALTDGLEQINVQVPWELSNASSARIVVTANGQQSSPVDVPLVAAQPEIFAVSGNLTVWATGLGPVANQPAAGAAAPLSPLSTTLQEPGVTVGGMPARVIFAGLAPNFVGLYQINVVALENASGDVVVTVGGRSSRPFPLP
jgi:uncharacterized protein (TIGR03437 family)